MSLTQSDLQKIKAIVEETVESKLEEKLEEKLEAKLEEKLRPIKITLKSLLERVTEDTATFKAMLNNHTCRIVSLEEDCQKAKGVLQL